MTKEEYHLYLQTPEWEVKRRAMLWLSNYSCKLCDNKNYPFHVHHRTYQNIGKEIPDDLIVLCQNCHETFHEKDIPEQHPNPEDVLIGTTSERELLYCILNYSHLAKRFMREVGSACFNTIIIKDIVNDIKKGILVGNKKIQTVFTSSKYDITVSEEIAKKYFADAIKFNRKRKLKKELRRISKLISDNKANPYKRDNYLKKHDVIINKLKKLFA